jgi:large subunit ribosomal protein L25
MASQSATVTAEPRSELGSRANKRLRDAGKLPGVIYGHKLAVVPITLPKKEVVKHLDKGAHLFALTVGGQAENVLVKDVQYDHLGMEVLHVDFTRVDLTERVEVTVPLELKGDPKGEAEGGVLTQVVSELEIECVVTDIPSAIVHNVSDMGQGDAGPGADPGHRQGAGRGGGHRGRDGRAGGDRQGGRACRGGGQISAE